MGNSHARPVTSSAPNAKAVAAALQRRNAFAARASVRQGQVVDNAPAVVDAGLHAPGRALDGGVRGAMEERFGRDFSDVRVHSGADAARSARALNADAFTVGSDIVFDEGQYDVSSPRGMSTLAHELTHVVQQNGRRSGGVPAQEAAEPATHEDIAARNAERIASGDVTTRLETGPALSSPIVQRQPKDATQPVSLMPVPQLTTPVADDIRKEIEAWDLVELHVRPELLIKFQEIGRAVSLDATSMINATFEPYDESIKTPDSTFASIFFGGAGNVPQGEMGGFLGGAGAAALQAIVGLILDTDSVAQVKQSARLVPDSVLVAHLTTSSPEYDAFERGALGDLHGEFNTWWDANPAYHDNRGMVILEAHALLYEARTRYGADSDLGQQVRKQMQEFIEAGMVPVRARLDLAQNTLNKRKELLTTMYLAGAGGALIGGLAGGAAGGWAGAAIGGVIGGLVFAGLGLGAAAIHQHFKHKAPEAVQQPAKQTQAEPNVQSEPQKKPEEKK